MHEQQQYVAVAASCGCETRVTGAPCLLRCSDVTKKKIRQNPFDFSNNPICLLPVAPSIIGDIYYAYSAWGEKQRVYSRREIQHKCGLAPSSLCDHIVSTAWIHFFLPRLYRSCTFSYAAGENLVFSSGQTTTWYCTLLVLTRCCYTTFRKLDLTVVHIYVGFVYSYILLLLPVVLLQQ